MAKYNFPDMSEDVKVLMLNEVTHDLAKRTFYYNPRFNAEGRKIYLPALKEAIAKGDEEILKNSLETGDNFNKYEAQGKKVSPNAGQVFAQSEFNKYYIRAICVKSIELGEQKVEVFRANVTSAKKHKSDLRIGVKLDAAKLLADIRNAIGKPSVYFPEITNGLSVRLNESALSKLNEQMSVDEEGRISHTNSENEVVVSEQ